MSQDDFLQKVGAELEMISKLTIDAVARQGASQDDIAQTLGLSQSSISSFVKIRR